MGTILLLVLLCGSGGEDIVPGTNGQEPTQATTPPPKLVFTKVNLGMVLLGLSWYQIDSGIHLYQSFFLAGQKEGSINLSALFWGITGTLSGLILLCYGF